jgi:hypothetical protein
MHCFLARQSLIVRQPTCLMEWRSAVTPVVSIHLKPGISDRAHDKDKWRNFDSIFPSYWEYQSPSRQTLAFSPAKLSAKGKQVCVWGSPF